MNSIQKLGYFKNWNKISEKSEKLWEFRILPRDIFSLKKNSGVAAFAGKFRATASYDWDFHLRFDKVVFQKIQKVSKKRSKYKSLTFWNPKKFSAKSGSWTVKTVMVLKLSLDWMPIQFLLLKLKKEIYKGKLSRTCCRLNLWNQIRQDRYREKSKKRSTNQKVDISENHDFFFENHEEIGRIRLYRRDSPNL